MPTARSRPTSFHRGAVWSTLAVAAVAVACASTKTKKDPEGPQNEWAGEARDTEIKHESCDPAGKEVRTFKGDSSLSSGKSFVTRVYEGGREVCSFSDLNGDGNIDLYTFYGPDGRIRRREAAYTISKNIDEIAVYQNGELTVVMRETNFDGRLDTWDFYEGGRLIRRERDKTGDGRIDEWWSFEPGTDNATIVQADARTGKPDPAQTVKLGAGAAAGSLGGVGVKDAGAPDAKEAGPPSPSAPVAEPPVVADAGPADAKAADAGAKPGIKGGK